MIHELVYVTTRVQEYVTNKSSLTGVPTGTVGRTRDSWSQVMSLNPTVSIEFTLKNR